MSTTVTSYKNFVGGEWVDAVGGETMEVLNPATGDVIAEVPRGGAGTSTGPSPPPRRRCRTGSTRRPRTAWSCCSSSPT